MAAGGYEYNLVLLVTVFGLTESGPGRWSVDGAARQAPLGHRLGAGSSGRGRGRLGRGARSLEG